MGDGVSFGNHGLKLDFYYNPTLGIQPPGCQVTCWPAILLIHGGCWYFGDKTETRIIQVANSLAADGFMVIVPNYRLVSGSNNPWPAQYTDVSEALDWMKLQASIEPGHIGIAGESAGAQLAGDLATYRAGDVKAWYGASGPYDLNNFDKGTYMKLESCIEDLMAYSYGHTGGDGDNTVDRRAASPISYIDYNGVRTPPTLLTNFLEDSINGVAMVPSSEMDEMAARLTTPPAQDSVTTRLVSGPGHALDTFDHTNLWNDILTWLDTNVK